MNLLHVSSSLEALPWRPLFIRTFGRGEMKKGPTAYKFQSGSQGCIFPLFAFVLLFLIALPSLNLEHLYAELECFKIWKQIKLPYKLHLPP